MAFLSKLFGKNKDRDNDKNVKDRHEDEIKSEQPDVTDQYSGDEQELTDEEIAAAEQLENEMRDEIISSPSLDYDGEFAEEFTESENVENEIEVSQKIRECSEKEAETDEGDFQRDESHEIIDDEAISEDRDISESAEDSTPDEKSDAESGEEDGVSFWQKLKAGLSKTKKALFGQIDELLKNFVKVDEEMLEELEELLITADVGVTATAQIIDMLRDRIKDGRLKEKEQVLDSLKEIISEMIGENEPLRLDTVPSVILVIGVNGAGKTTSIGKIAKRLRLSGKKVVVAAADTFRAAAIDQLAVWCDRAKVDMVRQNEGSDPAAVVFDAINYTKKKEADVLIIDTAGRLQNKTNLMNELAKINRVIDRELPGACRENLLVIDATTGQNAVIQAKEFSKAANITGITLNKLDGSAKGGIVISIKKELGIPVKFIGVGEKIDDMRQFDAHEFVDALFD